MLRILVADDHAIVREGLKQVLSEEFEQATISETSTAKGTIDLVKAQKWDILILDIHFPDRNGVEILKEVKSLQPNLPVVVLSLSPEDQYGIRVLKAGGAAYLNKESAPEELISSVKKVLDGGRYVSASLAEQLAASIAPPRTTPLYQTLSDRELEVLEHLGTGSTVSDIAEALSLSVKTVSTYRSRLLEKLRLRTTADLIRYAIEHRLSK
ncbi:MAG: response regulator transcription factor [Nitrospirota bacterium]|nr:MAG: response regulator transcription factor [Nitrospirota bacterium]